MNKFYRATAGTPFYHSSLGFTHQRLMRYKFGHAMDSQALILAIETSGRLGSVALGTARGLVETLAFSAPMRHSVELLPSIETLLKRNGQRRQAISHCFISIGPGSFTGLRIAVSAAKAMNLALGTRIVAVPTLDAIAANARGLTGTEVLIPLLDAKRGQFFTATYQWSETEGRLIKIQPEGLSTSEEIVTYCESLCRTVSLLGEGLLYHQERFVGERTRILEPIFWAPSAAMIYELGMEIATKGGYSDPLTLVPHYLRGAQVTVKGA